MCSVLMLFPVGMNIRNYNLLTSSNLINTSFCYYMHRLLVESNIITDCRTRLTSWSRRGVLQPSPSPHPLGESSSSEPSESILVRAIRKFKIHNTDDCYRFLLKELYVIEFSYRFRVKNYSAFWPVKLVFLLSSGNYPNISQSNANVYLPAKTLSNS